MVYMYVYISLKKSANDSRNWDNLFIFLVYKKVNFLFYRDNFVVSL